MTELALAEKKGWTDPEIDMLKRYGTATFNQAWLYISEEMVERDLGVAPGLMMMTHFYKQTMMKNLREGVHYREIQRDDPLVIEYFRSLNLVSGKEPLKAVNGKKYYAISGEGLKWLAMMMNNPAGERTRDYFLKVESLARDLVVERENRLIEAFEQLRVQASESLIEAERKLRVQAIMLEESSDRTRKQEYIYIMSTKQGAIGGQYKVGKAISTKDRQSQANTSHPENDMMRVHWKIEVYDSAALESRFRSLCERFRDSKSKRKEFYLGPLWYFKAVLQALATGLDEDEDAVADLTRQLRERRLAKDFDMLEGVDLSIFNQLMIEAPRPPPELRDHGAAVDHIREFCADNVPDYEYDRDRQTTDLVIPWRQFTKYCVDKKARQKSKTKAFTVYKDMYNDMFLKYAIKIAFSD